MKWSNRLGPGMMVTAAFIGPGTLITASVAGALFGYALLWVLLFAVVATIVLQEMSARLGLVTREGLGEALRKVFTHPLVRVPAVVLVVAAIALGNAAFQWGNVTGASLGLSHLTGLSRPLLACSVGTGACLLLYHGSYRTIERLLVVLVVVMSIVFVLTAIMVRPSLPRLLRGLLVPRLPSGSFTMCLALIGTTVVPYNLFLHAHAVCRKWPASMPLNRALRASRMDTVVAVALGGIITVAIAVTATAFFKQGVTLDGIVEIAGGLKHVFGPAGSVFFAIGLTAAGLTSAITAPLAASFATVGALGWEPDQDSWKFRGVWFMVLLVGTVFAAAGQKPVAAIILAQAANGLILPVIALFLLIVVNRRTLLGGHTNGITTNLLGGLVVTLTVVLGITKVLQAISRMLH